MNKKLKLYQFNWVEMSGGFDQLVNIKASSENNAKELFKEFMKIDSISKYTHCSCIEEKYTKKFINQSGGIEKFLRGLPIHKTEK
ncbi:MAG: hypothetical protein ABIP51_12395 [Bacteroidia bacterium]